MENEMSTENIVKEISLPLYSAKGWLKFLGILSIISGAFIVLFTFGLGLIIAWLPIWMGVLLFQSATAVEEANATGNTESLKKSLDKLKLYFIVMGVVTLIYIVLAVLGVFLGIGGAMMAAMSAAGA